MAPFYGWDSTASRLEPLRGGSLLEHCKFENFPQPWWYIQISEICYIQVLLNFSDLPSYGSELRKQYTQKAVVDVTRRGGPEVVLLEGGIK